MIFFLFVVPRKFRSNFTILKVFYDNKLEITSVGVDLKTDLLDYINCTLPLRTNVMWEMNRSAKLAEFLITSNVVRIFTYIQTLHETWTIASCITRTIMSRLRPLTEDRNASITSTRKICYKYEIRTYKGKNYNTQFIMVMHLQ